MLEFCTLGLMSSVTEILEKAVIDAGEESEICGILGGILREPGVAMTTSVRPLSNLSLRKYSFAVDVEEFCRERDAIDAMGLVPLALYHSHLNSSTHPSFRDRELPRITGLPLLILAWEEGKLRFECYRDIDGKMVPISVIPYYVIAKLLKLS